MSDLKPPTKSKMREALHTIANCVMPLSGKVSLMRLGKLQADEKQLVQLETGLERLGDNITRARQILIEEENNSAHHTKKTDLFEVSYLSHANTRYFEKNNAQQTLERIKSESINYNKKNSISGFLLYYNGYFLQRIEGPEDNVKHLMGMIALDRRHESICVLSSGYLSNGNFKKWGSLFVKDVVDDELLSSLMSQILNVGSEDYHSNQSLAALNMLIMQLEKSVVA